MSQLMEQTENEVLYAGGINTNKAVTFGSTLAVTGATTLSGMTNLNGGVTYGNTVITATTTTNLTAAQSGSVVLLNAAAGFTTNLPVPAVGLNYTFVVTTSVTSSTLKVLTDASSTFLVGSVVMVESADTNSGLGAVADGSSARSVAMNGSTTGGLIGTVFYVNCVSSTVWFLDGTVYGSGTLSTCIATS